VSRITTRRRSRIEDTARCQRPAPSPRGIRHSSGSLRTGALLSSFVILLTIASSLRADQPLRIGTITIENLDVYSREEAARGALYRAADRLHAETRPSVIRAFLLFREGDPYVAERLAETERNLRALSFLKSALVTAGPPHDGVVDVLVRTQDAWSLEPGTEGGSRGGTSTYGVSLTDNNLAGTGRQASISFNHGVDRTRTAIDYRDPVFFRPYWQSRFTYAQNSDGFEHRVSIERPFYSFATPWAAQFLVESVRQNDRLYDAGRITSVFRQQHRAINAAMGYALEADDHRALRLFGGFRSVDDDFMIAPRHPSPGTLLPDNRAFRYLFVRFERTDNRFIKLDFVNRDVRYEDFNLGQQLSAELAVSPKLLGAPHTTEFARISETFGRSLSGGRGFFLPSIAVESRFDHGIRNAILSGSARYVRRFDTDLPQTFVGRLYANAGWHLDRDVQFFADGGDGLRGYRLHSFAGSRNLVLNLEQRLSLGRELLQLVSPGLVAFVDAGTATNGSLISATRLKTDAGIGIRIGLPRSPRNVLRIDAAYAFNPDPRGKRGLLISFSSGQAF